MWARQRYVDNHLQSDRVGDCLPALLSWLLVEVSDLKFMLGIAFGASEQRYTARATAAAAALVATLRQMRHHSQLYCKHGAFAAWSSFAFARNPSCQLRRFNVRAIGELERHRTCSQSTGAFHRNRCRSDFSGHPLLAASYSAPMTFGYLLVKFDSTLIVDLTNSLQHISWVNFFLFNYRTPSHGRNM